MPETVIRLENISKQYRLGTVGTKTLRGDLQRWWYKLAGKEDPTLKIGQINQLDKSTNTNTTDYIWALKDINLELKQGEILGIIGKNGAGKSTLLKLLSRVTGPTTGNIKVKGKIASLLEVGTGFHPELTGRENIFLNGAILGMTRSEIRSKFDEIVDFAGVAKYIDTPVKRYSSGMYVRLAFAVAAHLEPDILVVDEVLAVGDAEFQKKAIGKMQDVSKGEGRTVLFVSHNMASIQNLCNRGILLENGGISFYDNNINKVVSKYIEGNKVSDNIKLEYRLDREGNKDVKLIDIKLIRGIAENVIEMGSQCGVELYYENKLPENKYYILLSINNIEDICITFLDSRVIHNFPTKLNPKGVIKILLSNDIAFTEGIYYINVAIFSQIGLADYIQKALTFEITDGLFFSSGKKPESNGIAYIKQKWINNSI